MVDLASLFSELLQGDSHVVIALLDNIGQKWTKLGKALVLRIIVPRLDVHTIVWLQLEILSIVVHDDSTAELSTNF
jgi:hypothetical protein